MPLTPRRTRLLPTLLVTLLLCPAVLAQAPDTPEKPKLPPTIQPGARLIYTADPEEPAAGYTVYDVVAVTRNAVFIHARKYQPVPDAPAGQTYFALQDISVLDLSRPGAKPLFYPAEELAQLQPTPDLTVEHGGTLNINGTDYTTVTVTQQTDQTLTRSVYDQATGLLLSRSKQATPPDAPTTPTAHNPNQHLVAVRQRSLPWLEPTDATWLGDRKPLRYLGETRNTDTNQLLSNFEHTINFFKSKPHWAIGQYSRTTLIDGEPQGKPARSLVFSGPGQHLGLWVDPQTLAKLQPGTIDQDPTLNTTLSYHVQQTDARPLAVFTETDPTQTTTHIHRHDLQTGLLLQQQIIDRTKGTTTTAKLDDAP